MQLEDLTDYDILYIARFLPITTKVNCLVLNHRLNHLMKTSLATEKVLACRVDPWSRVWKLCPTNSHHANEHNMIPRYFPGFRTINFNGLVNFTTKFLPNITSLNIYAMIMEEDDFKRLTGCEFWSSSLVHLDIAYCGLWFKSDLLKQELTKAHKLEHFTFHGSNIIGLVSPQVEMMFAGIRGKKYTEDDQYVVIKPLKPWIYRYAKHIFKTSIIF